MAKSSPFACGSIGPVARADPGRTASHDHAESRIRQRHPDVPWITPGLKTAAPLYHLQDMASLAEAAWQREMLRQACAIQMLTLGQRRTPAGAGTGIPDQVVTARITELWAVLPWPERLHAGLGLHGGRDASLPGPHGP